VFTAPNALSVRTGQKLTVAPRGSRAVEKATLFPGYIYREYRLYPGSFVVEIHL